MKNLTDFRKRVENGVDPRLKFGYIAVHISFTRQILHNKPFKRNETLLDILWDMMYILPCVKVIKETIRTKN